jgi:hypothetical protein
MTRCATGLLGLMLAALAGGCTGGGAEDKIMQGTSGAVAISYVGDVADTMPLARQYCARYERVPVFLRAKDDNAYYYCLTPGEVPPKSS